MCLNKVLFIGGSKDHDLDFGIDVESLTLEAWRGKKFTEKEREGFDVEKLIGVCGQVQVIHNIKDDGEVWANVQTCVPYPKNTPMLRAEEYTREIDRDQADGHGYEPQDSDVPF